MPSVMQVIEPSNITKRVVELRIEWMGDAMKMEEHWPQPCPSSTSQSETVHGFLTSPEPRCRWPTSGTSLASVGHGARHRSYCFLSRLVMSTCFSAQFFESCMMPSGADHIHSRRTTGASSCPSHQLTNGKDRVKKERQQHPTPTRESPPRPRSHS